MNMNDSIKNIFIFAVGAAIGSVVTWKMLKNKYEQLAQEEINSVKEVFSREKRLKNNSVDDCKDEENDEPVLRKPVDISENARVIQKNGYTGYSGLNKEEEKEPQIDRPYVISPEEFGELDNYRTIGLTYFADGVLADDDDDEVVEDVDNVVGFDSLNHFGDYEKDAVHVRNDTMKCDYEILKDRRNYSDVLLDKPYLMED